MTTAVEEVDNYFTDGDSVMIADSYNVSEYSAKLQYLIENPEKVAETGERGCVEAREYFIYRIYGPKVRDFLGTLISS